MTLPTRGDLWTLRDRWYIGKRDGRISVVDDVLLHLGKTLAGGKDFFDVLPHDTVLVLEVNVRESGDNVTFLVGEECVVVNRHSFLRSFDRLIRSRI
jgi:hypothetical protein